MSANQQHHQAGAATKVGPANIVEVERWINAPASRIFSALTKAEELERWFFTEAQTDPRVHGSYRIHWRSAKDSSRDHERFGKYLEIVPDRKVVFQWQAGKSGCHSLEGVGDTIVTITLTPERGGTTVKLVHTGWADSDAGREACGGHQKGWTFYLGNLDAYLSGGPDQRSTSEFGQRVKPA